MSDPQPVPDGVAQLRDRLERHPRTVPAPRRQDGDGEMPPSVPAPDVSSVPVKGTKPPARRRAPKTGERPATRPNEPVANLAMRVRQSIDEHLGDLLHSMRKAGVRTTKVELVEMLLWELPGEHTAGLEERLERFRVEAPRAR